MDIPKFDGQLKNWPHWWTDFKHAVHDNEELENRDKLAYLIKSITDPALQGYLHSGADTMDTYPGMLEVLKKGISNNITAVVCFAGGRSAIVLQWMLCSSLGWSNL